MLDQQLARYVNRFRTYVSTTAVRVLLPARACAFFTTGV